jgi:leucyl aminopeptidase
MVASQATTGERVDRRAVRVPSGFDPAPSVGYLPSVKISAVPDVPADAEAVAIAVGSDGSGAAALGLTREALTAAGFDGRAGQTYALAGDGPLRVAVGVGDPSAMSAPDIRDAAAAFALATRRQARLAVRIAWLDQVEPATAAQVIVEGILLARYAYEPLRRSASTPRVAAISLVAERADLDAVARGAERLRGS